MLGALEKREPESAVEVAAAGVHRSRATTLVVHADILHQRMKSRPAESPGVIAERDDRCPGPPAAVEEAGLLSRLALWLAVVAAEAARSSRPSTDPAADPPASDLA